MTAMPPRAREPEDQHDVDGIDVSTVPQGAVAVFQAPRPLSTRTAAPETSRAEPDWEEIESPFLDLVGGEVDDAEIDGAEIVARPSGHDRDFAGGDLDGGDLDDDFIDGGGTESPGWLTRGEDRLDDGVVERRDDAATAGRHQLVAPAAVNPPRELRAAPRAEPSAPAPRRELPSSPAAPAAPSKALSRSTAARPTRARPAPLAPNTKSKPAPLAPKTKSKKDRDPSVDLAITEIAGHLTFTPHAVTAWYSLPEVRWSFRPDAERETLLSAIAEQYAGLAGFRLHLRRTTRPFAADSWARAIEIGRASCRERVLRLV